MHFTITKEQLKDPNLFNEIFFVFKKAYVKKIGRIAERDNMPTHIIINPKTLYSIASQNISISASMMSEKPRRFYQAIFIECYDCEENTMTLLKETV